MEGQAHQIQGITSAPFPVRPAPRAPRPVDIHPAPHVNIRPHRREGVAPFVKELQTKIDKLRAKLEKTHKEAAELEKTQEALTLDLAAAERLLASERPRRRGKPPKATAVAARNPHPVPASNG